MLRHERKLVRTCLANRGLVFALLLASIIVVRYNQAGFLRSLPAGTYPDAIDFLQFDMGTSGQLSIAWLLAPACSMALATLVFSPESHEMAVTGQGSLRRLWRSEAMDAILVAVHVATATFLISLASGIASSGPQISSSEDVYLLMTGQGPGSGAHPVVVAAACLAHLVGTTLFATLAYAGTRRLTGSSAGSFVLVLLLFLPAVTSGNSFVSDILRNLPGIALVENPIHTFVSFQGVEWQRWVEGGEGPRLWFLPLTSAIMTLAVYALSKAREPWRR